MNAYLALWLVYLSTAGETSDVKWSFEEVCQSLSSSWDQATIFNESRWFLLCSSCFGCVLPSGNIMSQGKDNARLKSYKNKSLNTDEMRRRREEEGLQLRKQKKDEQVRDLELWEGLLLFCFILYICFWLLKLNICFVIIGYWCLNKGDTI